ncbi:hypothetical protein MVLG_05066 [Microbotryum lychnidis-dioicae p1A1 Lamole]|uniref:AB hydrolase-1 domain-containing protein n=1 Tax=Microbotryum lychnidis-dioicae (strain p1A1 Lamole / MvSl-1064) TaxID=683840 RepID=U5HD49_USTV1|nr:hypothetical protein MVLG_05066 [Microbotryum lychnidis-dioicae p1A1 Lamole]|eukprot:KDE04500.1 hypothetical protein MVLG_05066 [Microbotryum lychnidis-dioicae p1A1 Lamole]
MTYIGQSSRCRDELQSSRRCTRTLCTLGFTRHTRHTRPRLVLGEQPDTCGSRPAAVMSGQSSQPPSRVLGDNASSDENPYSDNPYSTETPSLSGPPAEIDSLDVEAPPAASATERTPLIASSRNRNNTGKPKIQSRFNNTGGDAVVRVNSNGATEDDGNGTSDPDSLPLHKQPRPWRLKIDFAIVVILLYVNVSFLFLSILSIKSPFIAHNALPAHRGSTFLPIWVAFLSSITNVLALLSFVYPKEAPAFSALTSWISAFSALVILILVVAVTQLRRHEGVLTFLLLALSIVSSLHAGLSTLLAERYAPLLMADPVPVERDAPSFTFWDSLRRVASGVWDVIHVSLPLALLHLGVVIAFFLLSISVFIRTVDSSLDVPGQLWKVDPWLYMRKNFPETGGSVFNTGGRPFKVHLACRGVGIDDPLPPRVKSSLIPPGREAIRRTILIESDQGISGAESARWVLKMLKEGELTSGDFETRVCYWDRPGYGLSDSSPTSALPEVVTALSQALTAAGEMARLEPPSSLASVDNSTIGQELETKFAPTPLARSGFVLVSQGYGSLASSLFATINPRLTHSFLYLSPIPSRLQFSQTKLWYSAVPGFFTRTIPAISTELGIWAMASFVTGHSRASRVFSSEYSGIKGSMGRAWLQEEGERYKGRDSLSHVAWDRKKGRYPERHTVVLSGSQPNRYTKEQWKEGRDHFINDVVREGLVRHETDWTGYCDDGMDGEERCRKALKDLVKMD